MASLLAMRVLVTGGGGFIGSHLVERMLTLGHDVVVFDEAALPSVPRSVQDPLTSTEANVTGTLNVLLNARDMGVRRVVFASSSSIYGANPELPKREAMLPMPISPYAVSK